MPGLRVDDYCSCGAPGHLDKVTPRVRQILIQRINFSASALRPLSRSRAPGIRDSRYSDDAAIDGTLLWRTIDRCCCDNAALRRCGKEQEREGSNDGLDFYPTLRARVRRGVGAGVPRGCGAEEPGKPRQCPLRCAI